MQTTLFSALRRPLLLLTTALPLLFATACEKDPEKPVVPPAAPGTIVAIAQANPDFSILVAAVVKADLATTLSGPGPFTVFAPINAAFAAQQPPFNTAAGISAITDPAQIAMLREIILYHAVSGTKKVADLATGPLTSLKPVGGGTTNVLNLVKTGNAIVINGNTNLVTADITASNGVIHVIDKVLMPASTGPGTIAAVAIANPDLSILVAAVTKAGLVGAVSGAGSLTVFAPTNAAFAALGAPFNTAANIAAITDAAQIATLTGILQYHVLGSRKAAADFATGASSQVTLRPASAAGVNDNTLYISKGAAGVFLNGSTKVTTADVAASNGIIHVIDKVLLPPSRTVAAIAVAASTGPSPEFTLLVQALTQPVAAPLLAAASNPASNLTVFAPTDAAFRALLTALNLPNVAAVPPATLLAVLQAHIITSGRNFSSDLANGTVNSSNGAPLTIGVTAAGAVTVRGAGNGTNAANVVSANILANNGVVHVIDRVLLP